MMTAALPLVVDIKALPPLPASDPAVQIDFKALLDGARNGVMPELSAPIQVAEENDSPKDSIRIESSGCLPQTILNDICADQTPVKQGITPLKDAPENGLANQPTLQADLPLQAIISGFVYPGPSPELWEQTPAKKRDIVATEIAAASPEIANMRSSITSGRISQSCEAAAKASPVQPEIAAPFEAEIIKSGASIIASNEPKVDAIRVKVADQDMPALPATTDILRVTQNPALAAPVDGSPPPPPVQRQLKLAGDVRWLDNLARDIVSAVVTQDRLSFRLSPENLGHLNVELTHSDRGVSVHMTASSDDATKIVAAAQPRLLDELRTHGLRVADAHVGSGQADAGEPYQRHRTPYPVIEHAGQQWLPANIPETGQSSGRFA